MRKHLLRRIRNLLLISTLIPLSVAGLSPASFAEDDDRYFQLFDGSSLDGWYKLNRSPVSEGWLVEDGAIRRKIQRKPRVGHIYWVGRLFRDFELSWEWKIAPGGNSGVKYRVADFQGHWLGLEYQLLDDKRHKNARDPKKTAGALYNLYAPNANKRLNPVGQYNHSRVVARGSHIEHWLNGAKILEADTSSADWRCRVACSKFCMYPHFGQQEQGMIMLQDHGDEVWFRNLVVQSLDVGQ